MKTNLLNQNLNNLLKSVEQNLQQYLKEKKPDNLHNLRLDIKKIKALFSFAEKGYNKKYRLTELKPLFKRAGEIREIQINSNLLSELPNPPTLLINQLKKKEKLLIQKLTQNSSPLFELIIDFRKKIALPKSLPDKKTISDYFEEGQLKSIKKLRSKKRERVHQYRTKIKKLMYAYNILPKRIQKEIKWNETEIDKQQEKLGNWHDTYAAIHFLSQEQVTHKTAQLIDDLIKKEKKQFKALFK